MQKTLSLLQTVSVRRLLTWKEGMERGFRGRGCE